MASSDARSDGAAPDAVAATLQKQLEYYFSDANLRRDAHLRGLAGADDDASLRQFVDLEHVLAFARARAILNESTTDGEPATKRAKTEIPAVALEAVRASSATVGIALARLAAGSPSVVLSLRIARAREKAKTCSRSTHCRRELSSSAPARPFRCASRRRFASLK